MLAWDQVGGGFMPVTCEACNGEPRPAAHDEEINGFVPDALHARVCRPCAIWCWGARLLERRPNLVDEPPAQDTPLWAAGALMLAGVAQLGPPRDPNRTLTHRELSGLMSGSWLLMLRLPAAERVVH